MDISRSEKLSIIHGIGTEAELREDVVKPILENMGQFSHIHICHGPQEKGKDIVTVQKDSLGPIYTAFILKKGKIDGSTSSNNSYISVSNQIGATILSGFDCVIQKRVVPITRVVVLCNNNISNSARDELVKMASGKVSVEFVQDEDLMRWIDQFMPDYYVIRSGNLSSYIGKLKLKCERLDELRSVTRYKGEAKRIMDIFVAPTLSRIHRIPDSQRYEVVSSTLRQLLFTRDNVWIEGGAGSGKSTLLRAEIQQLIGTNSGGSDQKHIPVLIRAVDLAETRGQLDERITEYLDSEYGCADLDLFSITGKSKVFLFIDGIDEIGEGDIRNTFIRDITSFCKANPHIKVVITSRAFTLESTPLDTFKKWDLKPFNNRQVRDFISRWFAGRTGSDKLLEALQEHALLEKLPNTPLALTLMTILFESDTNTELPANLSELYHMFMDLLLGKWTLDRRVDTFYEANIIEYLLQEIAYSLQVNGTFFIEEPQLAELITATSSTLGKKLELAKVITDLLATNIIVFNDRSAVEFRHQSFQEYFAAQKVHLEAKNGGDHKLAERFLDDWWSMVVYFYCGLQKSNAQLLSDIGQALKAQTPTPNLRGMWYFGYLIQSSYLTDASLRERLVADILTE